MFFIQFEDSVEASYQPRRLGEAIIWNEGKKKEKSYKRERTWNVVRLFEWVDLVQRIDESFEGKI